MKIAVQALGIHTGGGPSNHLKGFLRTLSSARNPHEWTFVLNEAFTVESALPANVLIEKVKITGVGRRLYEDLLRQRLMVERSGADVLLNLIDFGPLPRRVPTLSFQRNSNYYDTQLLALRHGRDRVEWELRRRLAHRVVRRSQRVLCPSETMAEAVRSTTGVPPGKVGSLHHPYESPCPEAPWSPSSPRRILYTGHLMPHKNHRWLLEVFIESGLANDGVELWMTAARDNWPGGYDALVERIHQAGIAGQVRLLGRVPPDEMAPLYRSSTVFVFASAGESFGFPMVEALSAGLPILAYDTLIAREILGSAAEYLSCDTGLAARQLMETVLSGEDRLNALSHRSVERAHAVCVTWDAWLARLEEELARVASVRS
jgi:glycosyltransferase involved in cell wall biosynthesis